METVVPILKKPSEADQKSATDSRRLQLKSILKPATTDYLQRRRYIDRVSLFMSIASHQRAQKTGCRCVSLPVGLLAYFARAYQCLVASSWDRISHSILSASYHRAQKAGS